MSSVGSKRVENAEDDDDEGERGDVKEASDELRSEMSLALKLRDEGGGGGRGPFLLLPPPPARSRSLEPSPP